MVEKKEVVFDASIKYKDIFRMKAVYQIARHWLDDEGWTNTAASLPENFIETLYLENRSQPGGKEMWVWWRPFKIINNYVRLVFNIDYHILLLQDREIMYKGQKVKTNWGEVEVFFRGVMETDWKGEWEKHPILKNFVELFRRRIHKKELEQLRDDFKKDIDRFRMVLKDFLEMKTFLKKEIHLFPPKIPL